MSSIITTAREFRADVLRNDAAMLRQLSQAYSQIERSLTLQFRALLRDIQEAQRQGQTVNQDWLRRSFRYQQLIRQTREQIANYSRNTSGFIQFRQQEAINLGQVHATELIQRAAPEITFARLPTEAINELVGVLENGSPLSKVLDRLGGQAATQIRQALITGLGSGHSNQKIARAIRQAIEVPRWKALQVSRTEVQRAYRSANLQTLAENSDVVSGWYWWASLTGRTCFSCWSLHGKFFPVTKTFFPGHVSCRCTAVPAIKGSDYQPVAGAQAFAQLDGESQLKILGPSRYEMFRAGMPLEAFTMLTRDPEWGSAYVARPLYQLKKRKAA